MMKLLRVLALILPALTLLFTGCSSEDEIAQEQVLVRIGNQIITAQQYIQRAEYTIRPPWCRGDDNVQRKIVLNSLVAEKLLAREGRDSADEWFEHPTIQHYLQGRREQEMRQLHYARTATGQVQLSEAAKQKVLRFSERTYQVEIIPLNNDQLATRIAGDLTAGKIGFDDLAEEFEAATGQEIRAREYRFDAPMADPLFKKLFTEERQKGEVVGPVFGEGQNSFLMRIEGWTRRPLISDADTKQRMQDVESKMTEVRSRDIYESWLKKLMQGKTLQLNENVFRKVTEAVGQDYYRSPEERKLAFRQKLWGEDDKDKMVIDDISSELDEIAQQTLFEIDGEAWSVERFESYLQIHPLVFRRKEVPKAEFAQAFRNAIADMIRDRFITEEAYAQKMDQDPILQRRMGMWEDNLIALYTRNQLLSDVPADSLNHISVVQEKLDPVVIEMYSKYGQDIEINTELFDRIKLSSVDMFVLQQNVPFPVVVPQFPALTTHNKLDYGRKMTKE